MYAAAVIGGLRHQNEIQKNTEQFVTIMVQLCRFGLSRDQGTFALPTFGIKNTSFSKAAKQPKKQTPRVKGKPKGKPKPVKLAPGKSRNTNQQPPRIQCRLFGA